MERNKFQVGDDNFALSRMAEIMSLKVFRARNKRALLANIMKDSFDKHKRKFTKKDINEFSLCYMDCVRDSNHEDEKKMLRDMHSLRNAQRRIVQLCYNGSDDLAVLKAIKEIVGHNLLNPYNKEGWKKFSRTDIKTIQAIRDKIAQIKNVPYKIIKNMDFEDVKNSDARSELSYSDAKIQLKKEQEEYISGGRRR